MGELVGVSTACKYPLVTEKSLEWAGRQGYKTVELFLNSTSEILPDFTRRLRGIRDAYGMEIVSVHPYTSLYESYFLFTDYERRFTDALVSFEDMAKAARDVGAGILVMHGAKPVGSVDVREVARRFCVLSELCGKYGVTLAQENVNQHCSQDPEWMRKLKYHCGESFRMVLDTKQAYRAGHTPFEFLDEFHDDIIHLHLSDHTDKRDCVPPFEGDFDWDAFFSRLREYGYGGRYIIELYSDSFSDDGQIKRAYDRLKRAVSHSSSCA